MPPTRRDTQTEVSLWMMRTDLRESEQGFTHTHKHTHTDSCLASKRTRPLYVQHSNTDNNRTKGLLRHCPRLTVPIETGVAIVSVVAPTLYCGKTRGHSRPRLITEQGCVLLSLLTRRTVREADRHGVNTEGFWLMFKTLGSGGGLRFQRRGNKGCAW